MARKTIGWILLVLGIIILVGSGAADVLGIGGSAGLGWRQLLGAAIGIIVALVGTWLAVRKPKLAK